MLQTIITFIQFVVLMSYIGYVIDRFGVLPSISDSTYKLQGKQKFLFTVTLAVLAILNLYQPMGNFGTFATLGLFWTGATVTFKRTGTSTPIFHYSGAIIAIVLSYAGLIILHGLYPLVLIPAISLAFLNDENFIWWLEIYCFAGIMMGYFMI